MRYIVLGRPRTLPTDFLSCFPSHQRPSFSEIQDFTGNGRLDITGDGIVLLVRQLPPPPPPDYQRPMGHAAWLLRRYSWVMQARHSTASATSAPRAIFECSNVLQVDWYGHLHLVVALQTPEVSST